MNYPKNSSSGDYCIKRGDYHLNPKNPFFEEESVFLYEKNRVWMDNSTIEYNDHQPFFEACKTHRPKSVLIAGLGIGLVLVELQKEEYGFIEKITVIEKSKEVVALSANHFLQKMPQLEIIQSDIFEYNPLTQYQVAWFDIWLRPNDYKKHETVICQKYSPFVSDWIGFWAKK